MTGARNGAAPTAAKRTSRSGRSLTESERRTESLKVRLQPGYKARLAALAESDGYSIAEWIETWVEMSEKEIEGVTARRASRERPQR
jgi:hypothetical protein